MNTAGLLILMGLLGGCVDPSTDVTALKTDVKRLEERVDGLLAIVEAHQKSIELTSSALNNHSNAIVAITEIFRMQREGQP